MNLGQLCAWPFKSCSLKPCCVQDMTALLRDVLLTAKLDDHSRFKQMVLETRSALETGIISAGHRAAMERLTAQRTVAGWVDEVTGA